MASKENQSACANFVPDRSGVDEWATNALLKPVPLKEARCSAVPSDVAWVCFAWQQKDDDERRDTSRIHVRGYLGARMKQEYPLEHAGGGLYACILPVKAGRHVYWYYVNGDYKINTLDLLESGRQEVRIEGNKTRLMLTVTEADLGKVIGPSLSAIEPSAPKPAPVASTADVNQRRKLFLKRGSQKQPSAQADTENKNTDTGHGATAEASHRETQRKSLRDSIGGRLRRSLRKSFGGASRQPQSEEKVQISKPVIEKLTPERAEQLINGKGGMKENIAEMDRNNDASSIHMHICIIEMREQLGQHNTFETFLEMRNCAALSLRWLKVQSPASEPHRKIRRDGTQHITNAIEAFERGMRNPAEVEQFALNRELYAQLHEWRAEAFEQLGEPDKAPAERKRAEEIRACL
ncbi:hypothetical protein FVE85_9310 [Porphyridium purpureum]|uniref:Uncharacterized protein n=1 Tax=Porphyridium purpureum TaxID=35688 RepID=A0A5J4YP12_PORPP|nr:hypothetical protein FVE85_9310 [Porphyridium purpureum]|eukprot:POR0864..scf222_8